jgi:hypothetical protein
LLVFVANRHLLITLLPLVQGNDSEGSCHWKTEFRRHAEATSGEKLHPAPHFPPVTGSSSALPCSCSPSHAGMPQSSSPPLRLPPSSENATAPPFFCRCQGPPVSTHRFQLARRVPYAAVMVALGVCASPSAVSPLVASPH